MAKKEKEVVEEIQPTETKVKANEEVLEEGGDMKIKAPKPKKPKQLVEQDQGTIKVDLSKAKEEDVTKEDNVTKVDIVLFIVSSFLFIKKSISE